MDSECLIFTHFLYVAFLLDSPEGIVRVCVVFVVVLFVDDLNVM